LKTIKKTQFQNYRQNEFPPIRTQGPPAINQEQLINIVKDDSIGDFDQITIERDDEGAIVVTKTKRVFSDGSQNSRE
jgi:hypothetical protein